MTKKKVITNFRDNTNRPRPTTLLQFSGGQDSSYVAWKWLTDNPDKVLLLHHINLYHYKEDRVDYENKAVHNILDWFQKNDINNWLYYESDFSYGNLPRISIKDIQICALFAGIIFRTPTFKTLDTLLLSWHIGEVNAPEIGRGYRVLDMFKALQVEGVTLEFPIEFHTREQMASEMPSELLQLVHTCRRPIKDKACGKCKTCKEMIKAKIWRKKL